MTTYRFELLDKVKLKAISLEGRIIAQCTYSGDMPSYRVIWWADNKRNDEWVYEFEL